MTTEQQLNRIVELLEQILTAQGQQPLPRPEPVTPGTVPGGTCHSAFRRPGRGNSCGECCK